MGQTELLIFLLENKGTFFTQQELTKHLGVGYAAINSAKNKLLGFSGIAQKTIRTKKKKIQHMIGIEE